MTPSFRFETQSTGSHGAIFPFERRSAARPSAANADTLGAAPLSGDDAADVHEPAELTRDAIVAALARVMASHTFRHSRRHRTFIEYVVLAALDGRAPSLKEVVIGLEVFGRQLDGYDPKRDSIVRVEARRLRDKLARYYAGEGSGDTLLIRLPTGSYVPIFVTRTAAPTAMPMMTVSPFAVVGGDPELRGFGQGLSDLLVDRLRVRSGLRVDVPSHRDAPGDDAPGDLVLGGSLIRHGSRTRCIVHMTSALRGARIWSDVFDFDAASPGFDVIAVQDVIVDAVVAAARRQREIP